MNQDRRDAMSVDDILNEYYESTRSSPAASEEPTIPLRSVQRQHPMAAAPAPAGGYSRQAPMDYAHQAPADYEYQAPSSRPAPNRAAAAQRQGGSSDPYTRSAQTGRKAPVHSNQYDNYYDEDDYEEEPRKRRGGGALVALMLAFILTVGGAGAFAGYAVLSHKVFPGVEVGGIDVSGMTMNEAANLISSSFDAQGAGELTLQMGDYSFQLPVSEVVGGVDANESARAAYLYGREGNPLTRASEIITARLNGADVELTMDVDRHKLSEWLDDIAGASLDGPTQPSYEIVEDQLVVNLGSPGVSFADREGVEQTLVEKLKIMDLTPLTAEASIQEQDPIDLAAIQSEIETEPKNATLDATDGVTVIPGTDGIKMDLEQAKSIIGDATTGEFNIPLELTPAEVDTETLQSLLFRDTLAETKTELNPGQKSRTHNVELACEYINGTILNPGDEFSYNKVVGQRTAARGFREAGIFVSGRLEEGLGGGVCQPSSTLYMAVLRADLKVTERSNHGMTVSYTPLGEDATVSWGTLDFKFVNDTEYPIKILASREGSYCKMKIVGTKTTDKKVEIKTNTLSTTNWSTVRQKDTSLAPGTERVDQSGATGYRTETFKIITENGQTTTVKANTSNYHKRDKVVLYNDSAKTETPAETPTTPASNETPVLPADPTVTTPSTPEPVTTPDPTPAETTPTPQAPSEPVQTAPEPTAPTADPEQVPSFGPGQPIV